MKLTSQQKQKIQQLVAQAWFNEDFKQQLLKNPQKVLARAGIICTTAVVLLNPNAPAETLNIKIDKGHVEIEIPQAPGDLEDISDGSILKPKLGPIRGSCL